MPVEEDISKAYRSYYTHKTPDMVSPRPTSLVRRAYRMLKFAYLADKYGYETGLSNFASAILGKILYLFPRRRRRANEEVRFLDWVPNGRLIDVGCGSGGWLLLSARIGWRIEGVDFDQESVNFARQQGLSVQLGSLEEQHYPNESFDAVTLSHVIEHVPDPVRTLKECARILKPGGQLVIYTPNSSSLGHRILRKYWRGLEPPRHLHLFGPNSLSAIVGEAGLRHDGIRARNGLDIWKQTFDLWARDSDSRSWFARTLSAAVAPYLFSFLESCCQMVKPEVGEWLFVRAVKPTGSVAA